MLKTKMGRWTFFAATLLFAAACGKKEPPTSAANLDMRTAKEAAAEAETTGTKGPLELTLRVFKTGIKSRQESLWYQVRLRNVGKEEIAIFDEPFLASTPIDTYRGAGAVLWVSGPDGKALRSMPSLGGGAVLTPDSPSWPIQPGDTRGDATKKKVIDDMWADRAILRRRVELEEQLEKKGVSPKERAQQILEFEKAHPNSTDNLKREPSPHVILQPGASITSIPWTERPKSDPRIQRDFTEFTGYWYSEPGKYRIKAFFDNRSSDIVENYYKEHGIPPRKDSVLVETSEIEFEVLP